MQLSVIRPYRRPTLGLPRTQRASKKATLGLAAFLLALQLGQDFAQAAYAGFPYYLSEDLVFAAGWLALVPTATLLRAWTPGCFGPDRPLLSASTQWGAAVCLHACLAIALGSGLSLLLLDVDSPFLVYLDYTLTSQLLGIGIVYAVLLPGRPKSPRAGHGEEAAHPPEAIAAVVAQEDPSETPDRGYFMVRQGATTSRIGVEEINYLTVDRPYVALHTVDRRHLYPGSLSEVSAQLQRSGFVRIHRGTLVRVSCVAELRSRGNGDYELQLFGGTTLRLSRRYRASFLQAYRASDSAPPTQDSAW